MNPSLIWFFHRFWLVLQRMSFSFPLGAVVVWRFTGGVLMWRLFWADFALCHAWCVFLWNEKRMSSVEQKFDLLGSGFFIHWLHVKVQNQNWFLKRGMIPKASSKFRFKIPQNTIQTHFEASSDMLLFPFLKWVDVGRIVRSRKREDQKTLMDWQWPHNFLQEWRMFAI